jgi:peroxiredoxin
LALDIELQNIDEKVNAFQKKLVDSHPDLLTSALITSGFRIDVPSYEGSPEEIQLKQYLHYKKHYFDYVDLTDDRLIRSPQHVMYDRVNYYLDKLTPKHPDSIIVSLDYLLEKMEPAEDTYRTFLIKFLNDFAASKIVGMDAVYVHLADEYYAKGKAPWVDDTQLAKIIGNARDAKPTLIGKMAPNFTVQLKDSTDISLYDIKSPYVVLVFWAHDCAHCKETMPEMGTFQSDYEDRGIKVFSICTKVLKDEPACWDFVQEQKIGHMINASDQSGGRSYVRTLYNVRRTPKVFVLDSDKKIVTKELGVEQLREYFDTVVNPQSDEEKE